MRQDPATEATLEQHQHAWTDYHDRLVRGRRELSDLNVDATTDVESNRLAAKTEALQDVCNRWVQENDTLNTPTSASHYVEMWAAFALNTYQDWITAHRAGEAGDPAQTAYATGLALASDYQRGYGYGIDSPPYIANFFAITPQA
ncbi:MAG: hypothetical protein ACOH1Y_16255 [Propionicimonas sp.]